MNLFVFYPDTYVRCCNDTILFVGLHNGKYLLERSNTLVVDESLPWIEITDDSLSLVEKCMSKGLGYILECTTLPYIPQKKLHVVSSVKRTSELMGFAEGYHTKDLLRELHILAHNLTYQVPSNVIYAQLKYPTFGDSADLPLCFITELAKSNIRSVVLSGDIDFYLNSCLFLFFKSGKHITIRTYGNYGNINKVLTLMPEFPNINIEILLDSIEMLTYIKHKVNEDYMERLSTTFIIKNIDDLNAFTHTPYKSENFIPILYDAKLQQSIVNEMLLEIDDIIGTSCSPLEVYKKQMIHPDNYGSLLLNSNGYVFDCLRYIGNIHEEDFYELLNKNLHDTNSLWYMTRRKRKGCSNCVFVDICPPLSIYEFQDIIPYACKKVVQESIPHL